MKWLEMVYLMKKIKRSDFEFSGDIFGPSPIDLTLFADLDKLVDIFNDINFASKNPRNYAFGYLCRLIEDIYIKSPKIQTKIRIQSGLTDIQWKNKIKNDNRKEKSFVNKLNGKGTSVYRQSINKLIEYLIWGNGGVLKPSSEQIQTGQAKPFLSQNSAICFVSEILTDVLKIEETTLNDQGNTLIEEHLKSEFIQYKKNPVYIPGLKAGLKLLSNITHRKIFNQRN